MAPGAPRWSAAAVRLPPELSTPPGADGKGNAFNDTGRVGIGLSAQVLGRHAPLLRGAVSGQEGGAGPRTGRHTERDRDPAKNSGLLSHLKGSALYEGDEG